MKKQKTTKRALLLSALSLVLCVSMLVGSTYAWFTDEVTSANNIIQSGTLKIGFEWANGKEDPASAGWTDASAGPIFDNQLWEPGYTEARHIKVSNLGTLALNWQLAIAADGQVSALGDVIDVYCSRSSATQINNRDVSKLEYKGTLTEWISTGFATGSLEAGKEFTMTVVLKMREEAGNEYQNLSIGSGFAIKLLATQKAYETDSFDKDYDKFAGKTVVTPEAAQAAIWAAKEGDIIYLATGAYGNLVLENEDGTPKNGITIEGQGANVTTCKVASINLNSSSNITLKGIVFDIPGAEAVYGRNGATGYISNIIGAKAGAAYGAQNVVIDGCAFKTTTNSYDADKYVPISFEEASRPGVRATNITIMNCKTDPMRQMFDFARLNYVNGTVIVKNNSLLATCKHNVLTLSGNSADLIIKDNVFGWIDGFDKTIAKADAWSPEKNAISTSRSTVAGVIKIDITGNTFAMKSALVEGEGLVLDIKPSYTADNCTVNFADNIFSGSLKDMTEENVPCVKP